MAKQLELKGLTFISFHGVDFFIGRRQKVIVIAAQDHIIGPHHRTTSQDHHRTTPLDNIIMDNWINEEVDCKLIFAQEATQLTKVTSLESVLEKFGYSKDDRINRRELVLMYKKVEKEMEEEIYRLANTGEYDKAKEMRARLTALKGEFGYLQTNGVVVNCRDQVANFSKASRELHDLLSKKQAEQETTVYAKCNEIEAEMNLFQDIERENLEKQISRVHRPPMKYSKRMIELFKAEHELIKLHQYEDARKVRRMIDKILPAEEKAFEENFEAFLNNKRVRLHKLQNVKRQQQEEKLKAMQWNDLRARELETKM
jgi:hypothetical protein